MTGGGDKSPMCQRDRARDSANAKGLTMCWGVCGKGMVVKAVTAFCHAVQRSESESGSGDSTCEEAWLY